MKKFLYKLWSKTLGAPANSISAQIFLLIFFIVFAWLLWQFWLDQNLNKLNSCSVTLNLPLDILKKFSRKLAQDGSEPGLTCHSGLSRI